jgi:hypothetical protein
MQAAEKVIQNHENENVRSMGRGEAHTETIRRLNPTAVKHTAVRETKVKGKGHLMT